MPELARGAAVFLFKDAVEIRKIIEAAVKGNLGNRLGGIDQQPGGMAQSNFIQAVDEGSAGTLFNEAAKGNLRHAHYPGYIAQ